MTEQTIAEWLTLPQTAKYIGMSQAFIRKRVRQRTIPYVRVGSKVLRFKRQALDAWMEAQASNPARENR